MRQTLLAPLASKGNGKGRIDPSIVSITQSLKRTFTNMSSGSDDPEDDPDPFRPEPETHPNPFRPEQETDPDPESLSKFARVSRTPQDKFIVLEKYYRLKTSTSMSDRNICRYLGIAPSTMTKYKNDADRIRDLVNDGITVRRNRSPR